MSRRERVTGEEKLSWHGEILAVQPRIRLMRSFDERSHGYLGYVLKMRGQIAEESRELTVAIGKGAQAKHAFRAGDEVSGKAVPVADPRLEPAELYKASALKLLARSPPGATAPPPALEVYRARGHRRLDARTYEAKCRCCIWGCRMPVEMIIDQWNPSQRRYRFETFCYGPKSCPAYRAGPTRKVAGRKGMQWEEEDWVDEEATAHRGPDD
ncbi:MAG: hypothetical protein GWO16_01720 [Gammaproteobacteria bacterium]|nr:hypothetical protein [Gammaproteobacteria bacterium]NIR96852.1 hypothetical protein [Gammaproteobacteria bacterium]NIT62563.1 hypothetical protein [Gammaproteobacteria bacterium]NIV19507.1 hypothetical protein [Gammaproteobacteria bacterium]NIY31143.1 hypothetical protein [Gammaproteobacteria bacterium]